MKKTKIATIKRINNTVAIRKLNNNYKVSSWLHIKFDEDKQRQQQRAEVNAKLQLYISNAQANRDLAQSQSKPMENLVNQTREAIQAQMTLIDNLVSLLKGLLGAVTRS